MTKHGYTKRGWKHPIYKIWTSMKQRCYNPNRKVHKYYGQRNITVCEEWISDPVKFIEWALANGYKNGLEIDRINVDGDYEPSNVRFVDHGLSVRNTRLLRTNNKSGYRGVDWCKREKKWRARIFFEGREKHLGHFDSPRKAALRYDAEAFILDDGRPMNFIEKVA